MKNCLVQVFTGKDELPSGASPAFSPASVSGSSSSTLTLTTSTTTPAGSYTITISGTSGGLTHTATVTLVVATPDFSLSASPASQSIRRGNSTTYTVKVTPSGGFAGTVAFDVSGLPSNATGTFSPTTVTGSGSSTLKITTRSNTPRGTFQLTITGTSSGLPHTALVSLTIN